MSEPMIDIADWSDRDKNLCRCGREKDHPHDRECLICEDCREDAAQERAREMDREDE